MDKVSWAWLAGIIEGEGCISWTGKSSVSVAVNMTDEDVIRKLHAMTAMGSVMGPYSQGRFKPLWRWGISRVEDVELVLAAILPHLGLRRGERARSALVRLKGVRRPGLCTRGHLMSGPNLYVGPQGERQCRECRRVRERKRVRRDDPTLPPEGSDRPHRPSR